MFGSAMSVLDQANGLDCSLSRSRVWQSPEGLRLSRLRSICSFDVAGAPCELLLDGLARVFLRLGSEERALQPLTRMSTWFSPVRQTWDQAFAGHVVRVERERSGRTFPAFRPTCYRVFVDGQLIAEQWRIGSSQERVGPPQARAPRTDGHDQVQSNVGAVRAFGARVVSAGGALAYTLGGRAKIPLLSRWPIVPLVVAAMLIVLGGIAVDDGSVTLTNPAPVDATLYQVANGSVPDGRVWVTVSGVLQPSVHEAHSKNTTDYIYVMTDADASTSILVRSTNKPLGASGTVVTFFGLIAGSDLMSFVYDWNTLSPWTSWARSAYPSLNVAGNIFLDANKSPQSAAFVPVGIGIWLIALWLVIGCLVGYVVYIGSDRRWGDPGTTRPDKPAWVKVSGVTVDRGGTYAHWRETVGVMKPPDDAAGERLVIIESEVLPAIKIDPIREARPGTVFPWGGERSAIRLRSASGPLVISFDDVATRDGWLLVFGQSAIAPNVIRRT
jgi:hypothetical protein